MTNSGSAVDQPEPVRVLLPPISEPIEKLLLEVEENLPSLDVETVYLHSRKAWALKYRTPGTDWDYFGHDGAMWFSELFAYTDDETGDPLKYSSEHMAMEIAADSATQTLRSQMRGGDLPPEALTRFNELTNYLIGIRDRVASDGDERAAFSQLRAKGLLQLVISTYSELKSR